jgi:peroxidase
VKGMLEYPSQLIDIHYAPGMLLEPDHEFSLNLGLLDCFRNRDLGLLDYRGIRSALGIPVANVSQISKNPRHQAFIMDNYGMYDPSLNNIDLWAGGLAEDHDTDAPAGPMFQRIFQEGVVRIRNGDRFWFENPSYEMISDEERRAVWDVTLADIIFRNTNVQCIQAEVFRMPQWSPLLCRMDRSPRSHSPGQNSGAYDEETEFD